MKWVEATLHDSDDRVYLNLDAIPQMSVQNISGEDGEIAHKDVTVVFLGGIAATIQGNFVYATTYVKESPEELILSADKKRVRVKANGHALHV